MPAAGVHPGQRWRGESVAEFGWLPGDQGGRCRRLAGRTVRRGEISQRPGYTDNPFRPR